MARHNILQGMTKAVLSDGMFSDGGGRPVTILIDGEDAPPQKVKLILTQVSRYHNSMWKFEGGASFWIIPNKQFACSGFLTEADGKSESYIDIDLLSVRLVEDETIFVSRRQ